MEKKYQVIIAVVLLILSFSVWQFFTISQNRREKFVSVDSSLELIKEKGKIIVGTSALFEPMSFKDKDGELVGFDIDLAKEIAKRLHAKLEHKVMPFDSLFDAVDDESIDLAIDSTTITPERQKNVLFSTLYLTTGQRIIVHKNDGTIKNKEDLKGKRVGAQTGTTGEQQAVKYAGKENVKVFKNREEIDSLKKNELDAIVTDDINAVAIVDKNKDLKLVGDIFSEEYYGIMTKIGKKALILEVNKIINSMRANGEMKKIGDKWNINWK